MSEPIYYDNHMHTPLCKHAEGAPESYAAVGVAKGLKGIIFTCHSPMPDGFWPEVRMAPEEFDDYVALIRGATEIFQGTLDVKLGMETDYFPGMEGWIEKLHGRADFHHCLGSVHFFGPEYYEAFWKDDIRAFQEQYFEHLADSAETGLFDTLAHPDLIKNLTPDTWGPSSLKDVIGRALDRIAATGVAMELNTSGLLKRLPEMNPGLAILRLMKERGIPVVIGSDSHTPGRVGENFPLALDALAEAGYESVSYFDARKRKDLPDQ